MTEQRRYEMQINGRLFVLVCCRVSRKRTVRTGMMSWQKYRKTTSYTF